MTQPSPEANPVWSGANASRWLLLVLTALRPPDGWVATGLLLLNMIVVVWSVEVADWAPSPSLVLVTVLAVLTAIPLTRIRLWTAAVLPVGLIIGIGVIIWQMVVASPDELQVASAAELFERLGLWVLAARNEGISVDPLPFAVGLMIAAWLSGYLAGWVFFRYRNFWGVFALGSVGLMSNLTFLPDTASIYLAIYVFTGLLLVGWVQSMRSRQRWDQQGRVYDGHLGILTVSDTSVVAIVALVIAFLLPVGGQWGPANAFYSLTRAPLVQWEEDFNRLFAGLPARRPLPYRIWGDTMAFQGTINPTDTPVLQVNSPVPMYWKARSYATYTHEGWLSDGTVLREPGWKPEYSTPDPYQERFNVTFEIIPNYDSRSLFAGGQVIGANRDVRVETFDSPRYVVDPHLESETDLLPAALRLAVDGLRDAVSADAFAAAEVFSGALPTSFVLESIERDSAGSVVNAVIGEIVPAEPDVLAVRAAGGSAEAGDPYQLTASVSSAEPDQLREAGEEYAPWLWARYIQLPPDMPARVGDLAHEITAGAETPYDRAVAVEEYLKTNLTYNLAIDPPPLGADGVDHFLFDSREGYSEYFGSAMTVLMRSLGVPARMATGYTSGNSLDGSSLYIVSDHHSHGWTEVYFPEFGWIAFEPTPGREIPIAIPPEEQARHRAAMDGGADAGDLPCEIEEECEDFETMFDEEDLLTRGVGADGWDNTVRAAVPWATGLGAAAVLLALIAWVIWRWLLATPRDVPTAYRRLRRLGGLASLPLREHQTPNQWAARLAAALPEQQSAIRQIVNAYARRTYSGRATAEATDADSIAEAWQALRFPLALYALRRREV
jgi:transglutaminase-like putative cysteine protease